MLYVAAYLAPALAMFAYGRSLTPAQGEEDWLALLIGCALWPLTGLVTIATVIMDWREDRAAERG